MDGKHITVYHTSTYYYNAYDAPHTVETTCIMVIALVVDIIEKEPESCYDSVKMGLKDVFVIYHRLLTINRIDR